MEKFFKILKKGLFYISGAIVLMVILGFLEIYVGDWAKFTFVAIMLYYLIRKEAKEIKKEKEGKKT